MFKNNIKIAWRQLFKNKSYAAINIVGLTIGLAVCFLLFLWVKDELSYDQFHKNADRIYRSQWEAKYGDNTWKIPQVPMPLAPTLESEFPEVELATQIYEGAFTLKKDEENVREKQVLFVDKKFFDVFTIETLAGDPEQAAEHPNTVVLTEEAVERYFGAVPNIESIVGQTIQYSDGESLQIAGVVKSFPKQSHLKFDFLASLENLKFLERRKNQWGSATLLTYFLLDKNGDPKQLADKIQKYVDENLMDAESVASGNYSKFPFEIIRDIHLKPNLSYIWIFGIIAALIMILACVNFINLATARSIQRGREVGVRKVLGSKRSQLVAQFFSESTLYVLIAVVLAVFLAELMLPYFNAFVEKDLVINLLGSPYILLGLGAIVVLVALLTGVIPAIVLSSFKPANVIKGQLAQGKSKSYLRQGLVVFQFCISSALIIGTLMVKDQLHFLQNQDMGFDKEQVMIIKRAQSLRNNYQPFIENLKTIPEVERVSTSQYLPGDGFDSTIFEPEQPSNYERTSLSYTHVDEHFVDALKLDIIEGRNFNLELTTDSTAYLLNETAAERLGWEEPVGKKLSYGGYAEGEVIGIVKDFNFSSLHEEIEPLVMRMTQFNLSNIFLRLKA